MAILKHYLPQSPQRKQARSAANAPPRSGNRVKSPSAKRLQRKRETAQKSTSVIVLEHYINTKTVQPMRHAPSIALKHPARIGLQFPASLH
jgi:hypothetical protein